MSDSESSSKAAVVEEEKQSDLESTASAQENSPVNEEKTPISATTSKEKPKANKPVVPKITLLLKPVGDAPIAKQQKWAVDPAHNVAWVVQFLRKYLKLDSTEQKQLHLFVNQCFAPSPDETLENLFDCFGSDNKLVLHYCLTMAWG